ncbi:hypothetical protein [Caballeronia cordobensis]|uniref:hypothetical protein n=1 Tax=Caballeronia cordobensis TaxID=1353886 RepID=UPI00158C235E
MTAKLPSHETFGARHIAVFSSDAITQCAARLIAIFTFERWSPQTSDFSAIVTKKDTKLLLDGNLRTQRL